MLLNCSINCVFVDPMLQSSAYSCPILNVLSVIFSVSVCCVYVWSCWMSLFVFGCENVLMSSLDFSRVIILI